MSVFQRVYLIYNSSSRHSVCSARSVVVASVIMMTSDASFSHTYNAVTYSKKLSYNDVVTTVFGTVFSLVYNMTLELM